MHISSLRTSKCARVESITLTDSQITQCFGDSNDPVHVTLGTTGRPEETKTTGQYWGSTETEESSGFGCHRLRKRIVWFEQPICEATRLTGVIRKCLNPKRPEKSLHDFKEFTSQVISFQTNNSEYRLFLHMLKWHIKTASLPGDWSHASDQWAFSYVLKDSLMFLNISHKKQRTKPDNAGNIHIYILPLQ